MGTLIRITVFSKKDPTEAILAAQRLYRQLDQSLSNYKPDSELNQLKPGVTTRVSSDLFAVLSFGQRLSLNSAGAFDVTVRGTTIGYQYIALGDKTVTLLKEAMLLDLGGIAKGYANDQASKVLISKGIRKHLLAASGDILVHDSPPNEPGWTVEFQNTRRILRRRAVSTSGNSYQPGHILDPRTGQKVMTSQTLSVLANDSMTADALATACLVLPPSERTQLISRYAGAELVSA